MRGLPQFPSLLSSLARSVGRGGAGDPERRTETPKAAARSQTDPVGLAQFAINMARTRKPQDATSAQLVLPCVGPQDEDAERQTHIAKGTFLARQEEWETLGRMIRDADRVRATTREGIPVAGLLARGARQDAVQAAQGAIFDGKRPHGSIFHALEDAVAESPRCWGVALAVALAHMEIGRAWLGDSAPTSRPSSDSADYLGHYRRAAALLDPYCAIEENSPGLARARCDLLLADPDAPSRAADDYADLIELDPANPAPLRQMGLHLMPRWFGSFEKLDEMAHEAAERTEDIWGDGGYFWVWMDVLRAVPQAAARLDVDRYVSGMQDIVDLHRSQLYANMLCAHSGIAMATDLAPADLSESARTARGRIARTFGNLIDGTLRELHPVYWAAAQYSPFVVLPARTELADRGETIARSLILRHFHEDVAAGRQLVFTEMGIEVHASA